MRYDVKDVAIVHCYKIEVDTPVARFCVFLSDKKRYLEKIIGVGNHDFQHKIDEQQMAVLLLVQRTDIVN